MMFCDGYRQHVDDRATAGDVFEAFEPQGSSSRSGAAVKCRCSVVVNILEHAADDGGFVGHEERIGSHGAASEVDELCCRHTA